MKSLLVIFLVVCVGSIGYAKKERKPVPALPKKSDLQVPYQQAKIVRVDPHGAKNTKPTVEQAKQQSECLICHTVQENTITTKASAVDTCFNCHNQSPHSGVPEHLKHQISCVDCHTLHRGSAVAWSGYSGMFKDLSDTKPDQGLRLRYNPNPMLKKTCTECHNNQK